MHGNEVNKVSECNFLHDILNSSKSTKILNIPYSTILNGFMNTRKGRATFKNFLILLDSGRSFTIVMGGIVQTFTPK